MNHVIDLSIEIDPSGFLNKIVWQIYNILQQVM